MNFKGHFIGGLITILTYLYVLKKYFAVPDSAIIWITIIGIITSLIPDIDTESRIRNIIEPFLIIVGIAYVFINIYVVIGIIIAVTSYRLAEHRGIMHNPILHIIIFFVMVWFTGWQIALSQIIGYSTHLILDKGKIK